MQADWLCPQPVAANSDAARQIGSYFKQVWPRLHNGSRLGCESSSDSEGGSTGAGGSSCDSCLDGASRACFSGDASLAELSDVMLLFAQGAGILRPPQPLDRRMDSLLAAVAWLDDPAHQARIAEQLAAVQAGSCEGSGCRLEGCAAAAPLPQLMVQQLLHALCCVAARSAARLAQAQEDPACLAEAAAMQGATGRSYPLSRAELATLWSGALRCAELLLLLEPASPKSLVLAGDAAALVAYTDAGRPAGEAALAATAALRTERYLHACQLASERGAHWWAIRAAGAALQLAGEPGADSPATLRAVLAAWQQAEAALCQLTSNPGLLPEPWEQAATAEVAAGKRLLQRCGPALSRLERSMETLPNAAAARAALLAATLQRARLDLIRLDSSPEPKRTLPGRGLRAKLGGKPAAKLSQDSAMEFAAEE
ncbi:hypothetical protein ABPG77_000323 [Micractinium sp. CCAP 211/92]